ncbi:MAG: hypothetical protein ACREIV_14305, partial [Planctomycetaceae bacterium]
MASQANPALEIDAVNAPGTRKYPQTVWANLVAAGIPLTLQFNPPSRRRACEKLYGDAAADRWIASRNSLLE